MDRNEHSRTSESNDKDQHQEWLADKYFFSIQEVLEIAKEAEVQASHKKSRKRPRKPTDSAKIDNDEEELLENGSSEYKGDFVVVAMCG